MKSNCAYKILIIVITVFLATCKSNTPSGFIEIKFTFTEYQEIEPSYQTAIWLEDSKGKYIKSLLVCEYLSYGGYNDPMICPDWQKVVNWESVSQEEYDAVTQATPPIGLAFSQRVPIREIGLAPGRYKICIESHIIEDYNIRCDCWINTSDPEFSAKPELTYKPDVYPGAGNALTDISIQLVKK